MPSFTIIVCSPRPAREVFADLVDWDHHSAAIPLTRLTHSGEPAVGQRFVARTGWARLGFDDPMEVRLLRPPTGDTPGDPGGVAEVVKSGRVVAGSVRWTVTAARVGSIIEWHQQLLVPWLPRLFDLPVRVVGRAAYRSGLRRLVRSVSEGPTGCREAVPSRLKGTRTRVPTPRPR